MLDFTSFHPQYEEYSLDSTADLIYLLIPSIPCLLWGIDLVNHTECCFLYIKNAYSYLFRGSVSVGDRIYGLKLLCLRTVAHNTLKHNITVTAVIENMCVLQVR